MVGIQDRDDGYYKCDICGKLCNRDEISLMNEFDMNLCDDCLEGQRKLDAQEEEEPDFDLMMGFMEEVREIQELERRKH